MVLFNSWVGNLMSEVYILYWSLDLALYGGPHDEPRSRLDLNLGWKGVNPLLYMWFLGKMWAL